LYSILSISIYYGTQLDIRVKSYCGLHLLRASIFNFEHLDILRNTIGHLSKKLSLFEFSQSFYYQCRASRYITGLNPTSEVKVIIVWICSKLLFWISSVSIYCRTQSDIRIKSYYGLNLLRASVFYYERLNILWDSIEHPSKRLLSLEFAQSYRFQLWASRYITGFSQSSELKLIAVCICNEFSFSFTSVSIYYRTQSDIRVICYCCLKLLHASVFNMEHLDILLDTIGHSSRKLLSSEFAQGFCFQFQVSQYITGLNRTSKLKVIVIWICYELQFSITSATIYYRA